MQIRSSIATRTIVDQVTDALRTSIVTQSLPIGARLSDVELASRFGVSRNSMRDAIRSLVNEGLVTSIANRGYFVADLDTACALELLQLRGVLEGLAAASAVEELSDADFARLEVISAEIEGLDYRRDIQRVRELDLEFHEIVVSRSDRLLLHELWSSLNSRLHLLDVICAEVLNVSSAESASRHRRYTDALRSGDPVRAERAAIDHYNQHRDRVLEQSHSFGGDRSTQLSDWSRRCAKSAERTAS